LRLALLSNGLEERGEAAIAKSLKMEGKGSAEGNRPPEKTQRSGPWKVKGNVDSGNLGSMLDMPFKGIRGSY